MPEELDPREQTIYDDWERKRKDYADFAATAPVRENPGLWRKLAAIGIGAFGGSQYDKGGLQWGQQLGNEVLEGPYQRKMNDHLKMLAAKRQGLDVAQEGMGVVGQIAARKAQAAAAAQAAADRKTAAEAALDQKRQYANDVWKKNIDHNTKGNWKSFQSPEELSAFQQANPKYQAWEVRQSSVPLPNGAREIILAEPESESRKRNLEDVNDLAVRINTAVQANPEISRQRGFVPVTAEQVSRYSAAKLQDYYKEIQNALGQEAAARAAVARGRGRGDGDDEAKAYRADEKRKHQETAKINAQFASLKASKENQYMDQIARARSNGNEAEAQRLEKQRGLELVEALNNAALQTANVWGHEKFKQYRMGDKGVEEFMVGKGAESQPQPTPAPESGGKKKMTVEIAKKFAAAAGGDRAKAEAMAKADGYTWE